MPRQSMHALLAAFQHCEGKYTGLEISQRTTAQGRPEGEAMAGRAELGGAAVSTLGLDSVPAPEAFPRIGWLIVTGHASEDAAELFVAFAFVFRHFDKTLSVQSVNERSLCRNCY